MTLHEILALKDSLGISIVNTSRLSGVPVITIAKIFSGETEHPRQVTLDAIERGLRSPEAISYSKKFGYLNSSEGAYARGALRMPINDRFVFRSEKDAVKEDVSFVYGTSPKKNCDPDQEFHTYEEFEALPEGSRVELIDGRFYDMGAPTPVHQQIIDEIHFKIRSQIKEKGGKCRPMSGIALQLDRSERNGTGLIPDFVIICDKTNLHKKSFHGVPEFVLEVLSPSNRKIDLGIKMLKYQQYGAKEYWIVDPVKERLIIYNFMDDSENPIVLPLTGSRGLAFYQGTISVDLQPIRGIISEDLPD